MALKVNNITIVDDTRNLVNVNSATFIGNSHIRFPVGNTSQRPQLAQSGMVRFNTDSRFEGYSNGWYYIVDSSPLDKNTIKPTLLLDFVNSQVLDKRITFSRASIGTYCGPDGLLRIAQANTPRFDYDPVTGEGKGLLIEPRRTNIIMYSSKFSSNSTAWPLSSSNDCAIEPAYIKSPDGLFNAQKLYSISSNSASRAIYQWEGANTTSGNSPITVSIYAKPIGSSNCNMKLLIMSSSNPVNNFGADYNLHSISVFAGNFNGNGSISNTSITSLADGWIKCSVTGIVDTNTSTKIRPQINVLNNDRSTTYVLPLGEGLYLWGAQIEEDIYTSSYIPSTDSFVSRTSDGTYIGADGLIKTAAANVARYEYNPLNLSLEPSLLLEKSKVNLMVNNTFNNSANGWIADGNCVLTANNALSPDGLVTSLKCSTSNTALSSTRFYRASSTVTTNTVYTFSFYAKKVNKQYVYVYSAAPVFDQNLLCYFDLINGKVTYSTGLIDSNIISVGNGWYRCWATAKTIASGSPNIYFGITPFPTTQIHNGVLGDYNLFWGVQVEAGNAPSSLIYTYNSSVTRAVDISTSVPTTRAEDNAIMTENDFNSWYNQSEGTFQVDAAVTGTQDSSYSASTSLITLHTGLVNEKMEINQNLGYPSFSSAYITLNSNITALFAQTASNTGQFVKHTFAYEANNVGYITSLSSKVTTNTNIRIPYVDRIFLFDGYSAANRKGMGYISKIVYYPKRLSNLELKELSRD